MRIFLITFILSGLAFIYNNCGGFNSYQEAFRGTTTTSSQSEGDDSTPESEDEVVENEEEPVEEEVIEEEEVVVLSSIEGFEQTLFPLVQQNCGGCHAAGNLFIPINPFAQADVTTSHDAVFDTQVVDLNTPSQSRVVTKINGGHQNISTDVASAMELAIEEWINLSDL